MIVGVDIGGTFTDLICSVDGRLHIHKLPSTPHEPSQALLEGLSHFQSQGHSVPSRVTHGSTVATNAILERGGARTALITNQGFKDILAIGRQDRKELYALQPQADQALIPRDLCFEIPGRINYRGEVIQALDPEQLEQVLHALEEKEIESVAVSFLYSYLNPDHEQLVKQAILERDILTEGSISLSSQVLPEFREYERTSTVALEAYVRPVMSAYIDRLQKSLPDQSNLLIMNSDGGVMDAARAKQKAVHTALSGPAAGVIGAYHVAQLAGYERVITLDMGGTSTDVSLCPGRPIHRTDAEIDGFPVRVRMLDIETIGAGGGSLARLDPAGGLHVGPASAGADPGPIIYGRGGNELTVTDAHAVLERISPDHFLGGKMDLQLDDARSALSDLAQEMGLTTTNTAQGILEVANASIERALRKVSIARGYDPRRFTLVAFGGAGPLHACQVAQRLHIPRILIPSHPGVLCAHGLLMADIILEESQSILKTLTGETLLEIETQFKKMEKEIFTQLVQDGLSKASINVERSLDMRYHGQSFELTLPYSNNLRQDFQCAHREQYGHAFLDRNVEIINLRVRGVGMISKPDTAVHPLEKDDGTSAIILETTPPDMTSPLPHYQRTMLQPGAVFSGPALVVQMDATTIIPGGWKAAVDGYHNLILEKET